MLSYQVQYTHYDPATFECYGHRSKQLPFCYRRSMYNFCNLIGYLGFYFLVLPVMLFVCYSIFHFTLEVDQQKIVLDELAIGTDWRQFIFCFSIYAGFAMKKQYDVSTNMPAPYKIANLLVWSPRGNESAVDTQRKILELIYSLMFITFFAMSPMVRRNILFASDTDIWYPITTLLTSHLSIPLETLLGNAEMKSVIQSQLYLPALMDVRNKIEDLQRKDLISELSVLSGQCDKLILLQQNTMAKYLTIVMKISMYVYFVVGGMHILTENDSLSAIIPSLIVYFIKFTVFLVFIRYVEQIVCPYNEKYDLFDLGEILKKLAKELETFKSSLTIDTEVSVEQTIIPIMDEIEGIDIK